ncbi:hypothetical protein M0J40_RS08505 [Providencia rettgeri]|uniref:hypothetical protein n=1 Tax=Providencia rettgeri TaxID=587 RepID=UPI0010112AFB|nr:hypothetical protein [Providencia rettgeri]EJD6042679.1 hypothetical protein [Providencia rettgeri]ELR5124385.1 hypothetical protein [Providencia rettgeri]ELR5135114.1 hypothetical protein [Providencia rettgeri]ELR5244562.1 hypothetical protein [Providencia rettgeri]ELS4582576.1 hypothetical protein [Providencia rettgeri]
MRKVLGVETIGLNSIPRNSGHGFNQHGSGQVLQADGSFLMYAEFELKKDGKPLNGKLGEYAVTFTADFTELPCDVDGNILMVSHWFTRPLMDDKNEFHRSRLMILCSKLPTHRINLNTGEIVDNNSDDEYIRSLSRHFLITSYN